MYNINYFTTLGQPILNKQIFFYSQISCLIVSLTTTLTSRIFRQYRIGFREELRKPRSDSAWQTMPFSVAFLSITATIPHRT